ncbi:hypothetical protein [Actinokineospora diospyrosa]|uniref:Uncharacterized protein n=1 Tax=Actinokineospora diospyrosa TaxID=103728 RepID=A0ABT1IHB7_9PSEU|nr:hypothetical protein [Actinokineospora diospyrosa]MCP2272036.1 hypothetical protein [Actinokineospora diospyrosa]
MTTPERSPKAFDMAALTGAIDAMSAEERRAELQLAEGVALGLEAAALGAEFLARDDLARARQWLATAARNDAPGAELMLAGVDARIEATGGRGTPAAPKPAWTFETSRFESARAIAQAEVITGDSQAAAFARMRSTLTRAAETREREEQQVLNTLDEVRARLAALEAIGPVRDKLAELNRRIEEVSTRIGKVTGKSERGLAKIDKILAEHPRGKPDIAAGA